LASEIAIVARDFLDQRARRNDERADMIEELLTERYSHATHREKG
jgi:hypothetical protein